MNNLEKPVELSQYRVLVRDIPRPTDVQIKSFIQHVSEDQSWYNQIPLVPPGVPFHFYLDNGAGFNYMPYGSKMFGRSGHSQPTADGKSICIETYRRRYGFLNYVCEGLTENDDRLSVGNRLTGGQKNSALLVLDNNGDKRTLGDSILEAGRADLTSAIHYRWNEALSWDIMDVLSPVPADFNRWPKESGGPELLTRIFSFVKEDHRLFKAWLLSYTKDGENPIDCPEDFQRVIDRAKLDESQSPTRWDSESSRAQREEILSLLRPERERQFSLIRCAITRVLELVYK